VAVCERLIGLARTRRIHRRPTISSGFQVGQPQHSVVNAVNQPCSRCARLVDGCAKCRGTQRVWRWAEVVAWNPEALDRSLARSKPRGDSGSGLSHQTSQIQRDRSYSEGFFESGLIVIKRCIKTQESLLLIAARACPRSQPKTGQETGSSHATVHRARNGARARRVAPALPVRDQRKSQAGLLPPGFELLRPLQLPSTRNSTRRFSS
jgi:hypothetical protein